MHARGDLIGGQDFLPLRQDTIEVLAVVNRWICRAQRAQTRTIAPAVVRDTARRVELDGLERPHERPAQAQSVLQRLVEILRRDVAVFNQTKRLRQQHRLQPVEDEPLDLALDDDRRLADGLVNRLGLGDDLGRRPRRADELHERDEMRWVDRMGDWQRWRPLRLSVNRLATMVEVEEARTTSGAARRSSSEKIERFVSMLSGRLS